MPQVPPPDYNYDAKKIAKAYEDAFRAILRKLNDMDLTSFSYANNLALMQSISQILRGLDEEAGAMAKEAVEKAAKDGVARTLLALGTVKTMAEAQAIVRFSTLNEAFVTAAISDTQTDLLAVTQNVERRVRSSVQKVTAEVMRANLPQGINGTQTLKREVTAGLRAQLGEALETGLVDAAGKRWKPHTYVDMLVRTKMMQAHRESTVNKAMEEGAYYGVISKHGSKDGCANWEGKVVKLTPDAPGDYTYIGDIPKRELFHNRCKHVCSPVRKPERYA